MQPVKQHDDQIHCSRGDHWGERDEFYAVADNQRHKRGVVSWCKECYSAWYKERWEWLKVNDPEEYRRRLDVRRDYNRRRRVLKNARGANWYDR